MFKWSILVVLVILALSISSLSATSQWDLSTDDYDEATTTAAPMTYSEKVTLAVRYILSLFKRDSGIYEQYFGPFLGMSKQQYFETLKSTPTDDLEKIIPLIKGTMGENWEKTVDQGHVQLFLKIQNLMTS